MVRLTFLVHSSVNVNTRMHLYNRHHKEGTSQFLQPKSSLVQLTDLQTFTFMHTSGNYQSVSQDCSFLFLRLSNKRDQKV